MGRLDQFETARPYAVASVDSVEMETSGGFTGRFFITNGGGGLLRGHISSNSKSLEISPGEIIGDNTEVTYTFVPDYYKSGDTARISAVVVSNGGEIVVPFNIKLTSPYIEGKDGERIKNIGEFAAFAEKKPIEARQLFSRWEFADWLARCGFPQTALFERLVADPNKERGLDLFLISAGAKAAQTFRIENKPIYITAPYGSNEPITGTLPIERDGDGFTSIRLSVICGGEWLVLNKERLTRSDFTDNKAEALFLALPDRFGINERAVVRAETDCAVIGQWAIEARSKSAFSVTTDRLSYSFEDEGVLMITNGGGEPETAEIRAVDSYIKIQAGARAYDKAEVPFKVRVPLFAKLRMRGAPYIESGIRVKYRFGERFCKVRLGSLY